jgi:hypothetical protein
LDLLGFGWTRLDWLGSSSSAKRGFGGLARTDEMDGGLPGVVLPVNPSTLGDFKYLQKLDPSGDPSEGVRDPSGII